MNIINKIIIFLKDNSNFDSAHDLSHLVRVKNISLKIHDSLNIKLNSEIIITFAMFHDFLDYKLIKSDEDFKYKADIINKFINSLNFKYEEKELLLELIFTEWKISSNNEIKENIYYKIVKDADIIDSFWFIWIARVFSYWWKIGRSILPIWDNDENNTYNYVKNKLIKKFNKLNFSISKEIAKPKMDYMNYFLDNLIDECNN